MRLPRRSGPEMAVGARGRALAWSVPLVAEVGALLRSIMLAWAAGPEELGRAMVLVLVLRLTEMISDIGVERLLMTSDRGDDASFLAALHGAVLLRGVAMAAVLGLLAVPMAWVLPDGAGLAAYLTLAAVPLLRGVLNLDYRRAERNAEYGPLAVVEGGAVLLMLLAMPMAVQMLPDHRAMLAALVVQAVAVVVLSHLVAVRRWQVRFDRAILSQAVRFGLPLVGNAFLMFLTFQADRLIIAGWFGWAEVAVYGVALQLASLPAQIAGRAAGSLLAPRLRVAVRQGDVAGVMQGAVRVHAVMALGFAAGFALLAPVAIALVYGAAFRPEADLALVLGLAAACRILRTPHSQLAVATGRRGDPARANLWRALALIPAVALAASGQPLLAVALAALLGEALATLRAHGLLRRNLNPIAEGILT